MLGAAAGGKDDRGRLDFSPFFRYSVSQDGSVRELDLLWPIVQWRDSASSSELYIRPLYNRRHDKEARIVETEWLYPFGFGTRRPDLTRGSLYPLAAWERETFSDGTERRRRIVLPFYYQRSGRGPADLLVLPFGGVVHNILGREKVVVVLWPLYVYQRGKDVESWSFLHPLFTFVKWKDGGRGYKLWPLYGRNRRPGKMDKMFVLWPIGHYQYLKHPKGELRRWAVFPFYGRIDDPGGWEWTILWPFFGHRMDYNTGQEDRWYFWPFLGRRTGRDVDGWTFWPFYVTETRRDRVKRRFLWPIGWYDRARNGDETSVSLIIAPLFSWIREEGKRGTRTSWLLWPLIKHRRDEQGRAVTECPVVLPVQKHDAWERNFAPFFRVFEHRSDPDGRRSCRMLWRLIRVDTGPEDRYIEVMPLFKIESHRGTEPALRWSILKGLVGRERTAGRTRWRFLYFIRTGQGRKTAPGAAEQ